MKKLLCPLFLPANVKFIHQFINWNVGLIYKHTVYVDVLKDITIQINLCGSDNNVTGNHEVALEYTALSHKEKRILITKDVGDVHGSFNHLANYFCALIATITCIPIIHMVPEEDGMYPAVQNSNMDSDTNLHNFEKYDNKEMCRHSSARWGHFPGDPSRPCTTKLLEA